VTYYYPGSAFASRPVSMSSRADAVSLPKVRLQEDLFAEAMRLRVADQRSRLKVLDWQPSSLCRARERFVVVKKAVTRRDLRTQARGCVERAYLGVRRRTRSAATTMCRSTLSSRCWRELLPAVASRFIAASPGSTF